MKGYKWGIGIEHETYMIHDPNRDANIYKGMDQDNKITGHVVIDTETIAKKLVKYRKKYNVSKEEANYLDFLVKEIFEYTGRKCNDVSIHERPPFRMPEFVTGKPFANKPFHFYIKELIKEEQKFGNILTKYIPMVKKFSHYGGINNFPFGMSNYFRYPTGNLRKLTYDFKEKDFTDYAGSYHITITLPYKESITQKKFLENHINFANQIQWIEPLLIAAYFSCDDKAVGSTRNRVRGSYRVVRVAWGNLAGTDVRDFKTGVGRYAVIPTKWRKGLSFFEDDLTKKCRILDFNTKQGAKLHAKEPQAISAYSSDMRTFGPTAEEERASGAPMIKPNGIEIRIFDNFPREDLESLCDIIGYIAENSRVHETKQFVYNNKLWNETVREVMKYGWKANLKPSFKTKLNKVLGIKILTKSNRADKVLKSLVNALWRKNKNGLWAKMLISERNKAPIIPQINKQSWELGFLLKLNRHPRFHTNLLRVLYSCSLQMTLAKFKKIFFEHFGKKSWSNNVDDILYFLESIGIVKLEIKNDKIKNIHLNESKVLKLYNLNKLIKNYFEHSKSSPFGRKKEKNILLANSNNFATPNSS